MRRLMIECEDSENDYDDNHVIDVKVDEILMEVLSDS